MSLEQIRGEFSVENAVEGLDDHETISVCKSIINTAERIMDDAKENLKNNSEEEEY